MAEFCWECWNKVHEMDAPKRAFSLSRGEELCEECGQMKRVVVDLRYFSFEHWLGVLEKALINKIEIAASLRSSR